MKAMLGGGLIQVANQLVNQAGYTSSKTNNKMVCLIARNDMWRLEKVRRTAVLPCISVTDTLLLEPCIPVAIGRVQYYLKHHKL